MSIERGRSSAPASTNPHAQTTKTRQIIYSLGVLVLFGAMWPYTDWLHRVKAQEDLGEATIGEIDNGTLMQKLAMVAGFRGVVANVFWSQAIELQKKHEWDKLKSAVDMITKLQPHFLSVWTFQGWNLAYNVSVEWDAPDDKYTWIKNGINFLRQGVAKNRRSPDLIWDTAWTYYHKIGMADEAIILRRIFHDDQDEEGEGFKVDQITQVTRDDNFQLAKSWFTRAVNLVDEGAQRAGTTIESQVEYVDRMPNRKGRPGDLNFRAMPAHAQSRYAAALEKMSKKDIEPLFGQTAQAEWDAAHKEWIDFGSYPFPTYNYPEQLVRLDDATNLEKYHSAELNDNQRYWTSRWSEQMNYKYWKDRCDAERQAQGVEARRLFYEGTLALRNGDFQEAVGRYKQGLELWKDLLDRYTIYRNDDLNQKDTGELVRRYVYALRQVGESPPDDMPFRDLYEAVKSEPFRDPFDQLDMMKVSKDSGSSSSP